MAFLLPLTLGLPLLLALMLISRRLHSLVTSLIPIVSLPALALAVVPGLKIQLSWLLLGMNLGVDPINAPFLLLAGVLWTFTGIYMHGYLASDRRQSRFQFFYLLTFTGNLGVILALDMLSFYLFFSVMSFAAYGLIVHEETEQAHRASRVYLIFTIIGEALLLTAILLIGGTLGNVDLVELDTALAALPARDMIISLIVVSFAIKMGAVPLHVWLALAHPHAPTPASALLSGIIIKTGLLGWLRFLPLGTLAMPKWGGFYLAIGMGSALYAALIGILQGRAKTVLAYSSISQMGLMTALLGIALTAPENWSMLLSILVLFTLHHGLAKGALFLGTGLTARGIHWASWALLLPTLALVGAPLTSGILAKMLLKDAAVLAPPPWTGWLSSLLLLSSGTTALLMARFLYLAWPRSQSAQVPTSMWMSWVGLLIIQTLLPWWWVTVHFPGLSARIFEMKSWIDSLIPLSIAAILALTAWGSWRAEGFRISFPEGDILIIFTWLRRLLPHGQRTRQKRLRKSFFDRSLEYQRVLLQRSEHYLRHWEITGILFLVIGIALIIMLALPISGFFELR